MDRFRRAPLLAGVVTAIAGALAGCEDPTQLIVVVDTDLEPGREVATIDAVVQSQGSFAVTHVFEMDRGSVPFSFGVRPARADDETVRIAVTARSPDGAVLVGRTVDTAFVPGRARLVEMPLSRACASVELQCESVETCHEGACVSARVAPSALPEATIGDAPAPLFDGPRTAPDAGPSDAAVCVSDRACEAGPCARGLTSCAVDGPPECVPLDPLPAGTDCGDGRRCDAEGRCVGL